MRYGDERQAVRSLNEYYSAMPWEWYQLSDVRPEDVGLADVLDILTFETIMKSGRLLPMVKASQHLSGLMASFGMPWESLESLKAKNIYGLVREIPHTIEEEELAELVSQGIRYGAFQQVACMMREFRSAYALLFDRYDLTEDGAVVYDAGSLPELHWNVASRYNDIVTSGGRCIKRMEDLLIKLFGKASDEYNSWKKLNREMYDENLSYAFCCGVRNSIEHGFMLISIVNVGMTDGRLGLAINLGASVLDRDGIISNDGIQNAKLRERLVRYRDERIDEGLSPWLSVAGTLHNWKGCIESLYMCFLEALVAHAAKKGSGGLRGGQGRCLVLHGIRTHQGGKEGTPSADRLYKLPPLDFVPELQQEAREIVSMAGEHDGVSEVMDVIDGWGIES